MPKQITGDEPIVPKDSYQYHNEDGTITIINKWDGLTIRQEFAARAMQAILSIPSEETLENPHLICIYAVRIADALIAELNKQP